MGQGQKISSEMQQTIIRLSWVLNIDQIAISLNLSTRSIRQVLSYFQIHGTIPNAEEQPAQDDCKGNRHLSHELLLRDRHKNDLSTLPELACMKQSSLSLLTKVLLIVEPHIVGMHGQLEGQKHSVKHFSCMDVALSLCDGILHCDVVEGSFCTETFTNFINGLLEKMQPYLAPNSVIVMDNCQIHKHHSIQSMIEAK
ncbi:hypothetical protein BS17DRAFT_810015 [Gyrodon lividus]|nr:hypothetical protein BS17DRAFT_810015 [Gyrodon lividus]